MDINSIPPRLTRPDASKYLKEKHNIKRSPRTLAKLAVVGGGPKFHRFVRDVFYTPKNLDCWVVELLSQPLLSTSDADAQKARNTDEFKKPGDVALAR